MTAFEQFLAVAILPKQVQSLSPTALAYVGDAVYELYIRTQFLWPPQRLQRYHSAVVSQVRAEQQADYLAQLSPQLTAAEQEMVRRGRNAAPRRQRRVSADVYQQATSFEALVGYLYLTNQPRLLELLSLLALKTD
ncbi:MAG: Mini-ribonuclease 3 [Leptolyngbya sp. SIO4C1]|nr:Mini-ribonuclease 3 [Leptolyngbya sp. SIO4C1]